MLNEKKSSLVCFIEIYMAVIYSILALHEASINVKELLL